MTKKIEVFASEALPGELEAFPDIKRGWGTTKEITGGIPPMKWFNAIQKRTDESINAIAEGSISGCTFKDGATLDSHKDLIYDDVSKSWYFWIGESGKVIPPNSNTSEIIESDGGIWSDTNPDGLWVNVGDASLRGLIFNDNSQLRMTSDGRYALRDEVFARDFGVLSSDTIDQFRQLQDAFDYCAANNKKLIIPSGVYLISEPLVYKSNGWWNNEITGFGGNVVIKKTTNKKANIGDDVYGINCDQDAVIVIPSWGGKQSKSARISGLHLSGAGSVTPEFGIFTSTLENCHLHDLVITKVGVGILDSGSWVSSIDRVIFRDVVNGGYCKLTGTSTSVKSCYVDKSGGYGFMMQSAYSEISNCAVDKSKTYAYVFNAVMSSANSDDTVKLTACGSENSGAGAAVQVNGACFLSIDNLTAYNWDQQQVPTPAALIELNCDSTNVMLKNVRYLGVSQIIKEKGNWNVITLDNVTTRGTPKPLGDIAQNTRVLMYDMDGIKFFRGYDLGGIGFGVEDIIDGNKNQKLSGLRNKQIIYRDRIRIDRLDSKSYGTKSINITDITGSYELKDYDVTATIDLFSVGDGVLHKPTVFIVKRTSGFDLVVNAATSTWQSFNVCIILTGVKY